MNRLFTFIATPPLNELNNIANDQKRRNYIFYMAAYSAARFALCNDFWSCCMCAKSVRLKRYFHHPLRDGFGRNDS